MNNCNLTRRKSAFTLIELLVVIAIIGLLAAMIIPITAALERVKKRKVARTELSQLVAMIDAYKAKTGFYPPDNPNNTVSNQLYFELSGCLLTNNVAGTGQPGYVTFDGSGAIQNAECSSYFGAGVQGIANSSASKRSTDDTTAAQSFVVNLLPRQIGSLDTPPGRIKIIVSGVQWPGDGRNGPIAADRTLTPWQYRSTNPTNNPNSYDLWVDILVGNKTNRISNWNSDYQQL